MSCCGASPDYEEIDEVSRLVSGKLAAFLKTLRDNAFAVGLQEGRDAAALMAAAMPKSQGFCGSRSSICSRRVNIDWDKFDGLFDAFWLGRRVKSRSITMGSAKPANNPSLKSLQDSRSERAGSEPRPTRFRPPTKGPRIAPAKAAWRAPQTPTIWPRSIFANWPTPIRSSRPTPPRRGWRKSCARADPPRSGAAARLPARFATNHPRNITMAACRSALVRRRRKKSRCG